MGGADPRGSAGCVYCLSWRATRGSGADFDATDDAVHGHQEGRFFHGYYDHYCFLPLYVAYPRPSKIDGAKHAWAILALLVKKLRQAWPGVRIVFRGDGGFCRHKMLGWCERQGVGYIVGLTKNARLNDLAAPWTETAEKGFASSGLKQALQHARPRNRNATDATTSLATRNPASQPPPNHAPIATRSVTARAKSRKHHPS